MANKVKKSDGEVSEQPQEVAAALTISIYQNTDHIAGILQQAYRQGLLRSSLEEQGKEGARTTSKESATRVEGRARGHVPTLADLGLSANYTRGGASGEEDRASSGRSTQYEYTEAYYLHYVKQFLEANGMIRHVSGAEQAATLKPGDFVEYQASFRANQITPFLDVLTPDLMAQIFHSRRMTDAANRFSDVEGFDGLEGFERVQAYSHQARVKAESEAELARAITKAIREDFRSDATREFYGTISESQDADDDVIAVTICDNACFIVEDPGRLLDGYFTVLGKVTRPVQVDLPLLERNKLLSRIEPEALDSAFTSLEEAAKRSTNKLSSGNQDAISTFMDANLDSRISGPSFAVIPIAIYL